MSEENINRLSDEERKKIEARRERIIQEIAILNWELAGEPDSDDERILEEMELNSPEKHLDDLIDEKQKLEEELFKDQYYKEIYNIIRNADYKSYEIPKLLTDDISDIDMFNRKNKAIQVTEAICHDSIKSSFNVGIIGEWGTGKSTLLNMIKMEIAKKKEMIEVSYDASSYSEQDQIWQNFSKILFEKYEKTRMFPNLRYTFSKVKRSPKKYISILLVNIIICIIIFLLAWGIKYSFSINSLISKFSGFGLSVVGVLLLFSRIIYPFGKKLLETSIPLSKKVNNTFKLPSYVENLGTRERVKEELDILFDAWIPRKNQKVVIFVDELDRCSEKGIVQFFQSIQLFFETKKIMFVFAIDSSHLKRALAKNFEIGEQNIDQYTNNFLDKYISFVIPIDNKVNLIDYMETLIRQINNENKLGFSGKEILQIKKCIQYIKREFMTPRKIKKIINLLILTKSFCVHNNSEWRVNYCELFTWIIMNCFYHEAANYITSLYKKKFEYSPLHIIFGNLTYYTFMKELMPNEQYYKLIKDFKMHDIVIYNRLANDFSILI